MAQDLMKMSVEYFRLVSYKISTSQLKSLIKQIYDLKWSEGNNFSFQDTCDLERKETIINQILMERGYLNKSIYDEYFGFLKKINFKKKVY